jgi:hypothetical protein
MHSPTWRPPGLTAGLDGAAGILRTTPDELRWMVDDVPRAIIEGRDVRPPKLGKMPTSGPRRKYGGASRARTEPGEDAVSRRYRSPITVGARTMPGDGLQPGNAVALAMGIT